MSGRPNLAVACSPAFHGFSSAHISGMLHHCLALGFLQVAQCLLQRHEPAAPLAAAGSDALAGATQEAAAACFQSNPCGQCCPAAAAAAAAAGFPADAYVQPGSARYAHMKSGLHPGPRQHVSERKHPATGLSEAKAAIPAVPVQAFPLQPAASAGDQPPCQLSLQPPSPSTVAWQAALGELHAVSPMTQSFPPCMPSVIGHPAK